MGLLFETITHGFLFGYIKIEFMTRLLIERKNKEVSIFWKKFILSNFYVLIIFLKLNSENKLINWLLFQKNRSKKKNNTGIGFFFQSELGFLNRKICFLFLNRSEIKFSIFQLTDIFGSLGAEYAIFELLSKFLFYFKIDFFCSKKKNKFQKIYKYSLVALCGNFENSIYFFTKFSKINLEHLSIFLEKKRKSIFFILISNRITKLSFSNIFFSEEKCHHLTVLFLNNKKKKIYLAAIKLNLFKLKKKKFNKKKKFPPLIFLKVFFKINFNMKSKFSETFFSKKKNTVYKKSYISKFTFFLNLFYKPKIKIIKNERNLNFCILILQNFKNFFQFGIRIENKKWNFRTKEDFKLTFDRGILVLYF
ncbi:hypothetical protein CMESO_275 (nucleomorph) [Chroomonas mesostigmatica CCMP1168]|uniref:Uncharacterized protein n=1 Tax=Chroomonas mesostigmatica CCMP1168 TaxID=1195612 RepID=J7G5U6_9CRYP|nr:hypothetical protein CMESO_275 [Chroomonas mesostigmatica CCMP1168]